MINFSEKVEKFPKIRPISETNESVYLMACPWSGCISSEAVERRWEWGKRNELSCLRLAPTPEEDSKGFCSACMRSQSQHAHTMHIEYDAHLPLLQWPCASNSFDVEEDPCLLKKQEAWDPHPAAEDQVQRDLGSGAEDSMLEESCHLA